MQPWTLRVFTIWKIFSYDGQNQTQKLFSQLQKEMVLFALGYFGMSGRRLLEYRWLLRYPQRPMLRPAIILHRLFLLLTGVLTVLCCLAKKIPHKLNMFIFRAFPSWCFGRKEIRCSLLPRGLRL